MQPSLKRELERLSRLAYYRLESCGRLVRDFHRLRRTARKHPDFALLEKVYAWLFVPFTLWAVDLEGLYEEMQQRIGRGERLESELCLLVASLPPIPREETQAIASEHEHAVQRGDYSGQVKVSAKYELSEEKLLKDCDFVQAWAALKACFDVTQHQDRKGIIRRRIVSERAFRSEWSLNWKEPVARFQAVFDAFCQRWNLYGMAGERPLLQKLTVNLTPHGTMIFIPSWWSLDPKRDLNWREIKRLHKARVPSNQGAKLTRNQMEQAEEAERAARLDAEARASGLRGEKREQWVMEKLNWIAKDSRTLRLVLSRAKRLKARR